LISFSYSLTPWGCWLNALKGISLPTKSSSLSKGQATVSNTLHFFLTNLSKQPKIAQLLDSNYRQHQITLIHHDLDTIEYQDSLINQLLTANLLSITIHNTRNLSNTTKYTQLLETLTMHKVDFCSVTETGHLKGQKYKLTQHPTYSAF